MTALVKAAFCIEDGCGVKAYVRGFCNRHYHKARYAGSAMPPTKRELIERFFEQAIQSNTDACIDWPFGKTSICYGQTYMAGKPEHAHVYVCRLVHGEKPPEKDHAAHNCGRPICVNPRHLRWATRAENMADKIRHGTDDRGEANVQAKLTDDAVREIRRLRGVETQRKLARRFGVRHTTIGAIQRGKNWAHVK